MGYEFSNHAREKLKERSIGEEEVIAALQNPKHLFLDSETGNSIAISAREKPNHYLIVVFRKVERKIKIVTVIDTSSVERIVEKREKKGRWIRL
jgi:uncharacterized DUF497 family protein